MVQLIVNDGTVDSTPVTVTISTQDTAPVANAGPAQTVAIGALVSLNGSGSADADGQTLTYRWSILSAPVGSTATLSSGTAVSPIFTADLYGTYVIQLIVNDGYLNSSPSTVTISTSDSAPVANPGPAQTMMAGSTINLTGAASSDSDGQTLTYNWAILSSPTGSAAVLSNATVVTPSFIADLAGAYVMQLIVNDGILNSTPQTVMITATAPNRGPVVRAEHLATARTLDLQVENAGAAQVSGSSPAVSFQYGMFATGAGCGTTPIQRCLHRCL